jgi:hypothetical protein
VFICECGLHKTCLNGEETDLYKSVIKPYMTLFPKLILFHLEYVDNVKTTHKYTSINTFCLTGPTSVDMIYLKYKSTDRIVTRIKVKISANQVLSIPLRESVMTYKVSLHDLEKRNCSDICKSCIMIPFLELWKILRLFT